MSETTNQPPQGISRTSLYTAAGRAIGAREPDPSVRNPDYLAEKLIGDPSALNITHASVKALSLSYDEAMKDVEVVSTVRMMLVRTRFIDEALARAIASGAAHVVILGAGLDSHAYRCQPLLAGAQVFEVDRPATQALKQQRVRDALGGPPPNLTYVPIDIQHDDLAEVLRLHGHDRAQKTFFIMEGVTMYVPEDGVRATLRYVAGHPPGTAIVFDFYYRPMVDMLKNIDWVSVPDSFKPYVQRFLDLIKDEPWVFGIPAGGEQTFLSECGLELREAMTIGGPESIARYATKADGTQIGAEAIAAGMARMAERAREAGPSSPEARAVDPERMRQQQRTMAYQLAEAVVPS
jgi:methyltransferase (TIGR00027 family)